MDHHRFDDFARLIGTGASRRRVLKGLFGGVFGFLGVERASAQGSCIETGEECQFDQECCGGRCHAPGAGGDKICHDCVGQFFSCVGATCCVGLFCDTDSDLTCQILADPGCSLVGEACDADGDCCLTIPAMTCEQGQCTFICSGEGESCFPVQGAGLEPFVPCCDGFTCNENNVCEAAGSCSFLGEECEETADCCSEFQVCQSVCCIPNGDVCVVSDQCCGDSTCEDDVCIAAPTCDGYGSTCDTDPDTCCEGLACENDECCKEAGTGCEVSGECCEGLVCFAGVCQEPNPCVGEGGSCSGNLPGTQGFTPCCEGFTCNENNICETVEGPTCAEEGDDCAGDLGEGLDCCGNLLCKHAMGEAGVCVAVCGETGDACEELLDCCAPDFVCNTDTNQCEAAAPADCEIDDDCDAGEICCGYGSGQTGCVVQECCGVDDEDHCDTGEVCTAANVCEAAGPTCSVDADCNIAPAGADDDDDAAICCGGTCITGIECCIDSANPNERCDDGEHCFEGVCVFACKGDADCDGDTCCCADGSCSTSCCQDDDTGGVDQLPSTGAGDDQGLSSLLGAGILAAGAAYLAGKKLRPTDEAP